MNSRIYLTLLLFFLSFSLQAQSIPRIDGSTIEVDELDAQFRRLQSAANVHGISIAIVSSDRIFFQKSYGYRNLKTKQALEHTHNFYAASLSKPLFAFMVMKLVDSGELDLDKPLVEYLDDPLPSYTFKHGYEGYQELENDERYKKITARMCLAHTSGFPNWRYISNSGINMENPLAIESDPGTIYSYSGEGIQLLQFVVEQITKKSLEELAKAYVFEAFGMGMTSFLWQERFDSNYAIGHVKKKKGLERRKRNEEYAAGSMDTTPEDYSKFIQAILGQQGLSKAAYEEMFRPQISIRSKQQFGKERLVETAENDAIKLSYGLGWGIYKTPHGKAVFKEGHIRGWEHQVILYPSQNIAIILMSNSSNAEGIFKETIELAMGDSWMPWYWENFIPYNAGK